MIGLDKDWIDKLKDFPTKEPQDWIDEDRKRCKPFIRPCSAPGHDFPSHLYIPPGQKYTHRCPYCGYEVTVTSIAPIW